MKEEENGDIGARQTLVRRCKALCRLCSCRCATLLKKSSSASLSSSSARSANCLGNETTRLRRRATCSCKETRWSGLLWATSGYTQQDQGKLNNALCKVDGCLLQRRGMTRLVVRLLCNLRARRSRECHQLSVQLSPMPPAGHGHACCQVTVQCQRLAQQFQGSFIDALCA